jgi:hypothetical protein
MSEASEAILQLRHAPRASEWKLAAGIHESYYTEPATLGWSE